jgi:hypothetical protein
MFSITEWLDRAKSRAGIETDYRLSKLAGITTQAISGYRSGVRMPDDSVILKICALSGDDPEHVAACIQSMRAANDDAADLWRRVANRLQKGFVTLSMVLTLAILSIAWPLGPVQTGVAILCEKGSSLYIMLRPAWRLMAWLWHMTRRKHLRAALA